MSYYFWNTWSLVKEELICIITRENNRKYTWKKSQVCQTILAISNSMRHHTCDCYLRFFRVYLRFVSYLRYFFLKHTCDLNRKYALKKNIASMIQIASTREKIASSNRKYGGAWNLKSQVWSDILAIFSTCTCDCFPLWWCILVLLSLTITCFRNNRTPNSLNLSIMYPRSNRFPSYSNQMSVFPDPKRDVNVDVTFWV